MRALRCPTFVRDRVGRSRSVVLSVVCGLVAAVAGASEPGEPSALAPFQVVAEGLEGPLGIVVRPGGEVLFSDRRGGAVLRVAPETGEVIPVAVNLRRPAGLALTAEGHLFIVEEKAGRVLRMAGDGSLAVVARGIEAPRWIAVADDGTAYVSARRAKGNRRDESRAANGSREVVVRIAPGGGPTVFAAGFKGLEGIVAHGSSLFVVARRASQGSSGGVFRIPVLPDGSAGPISKVTQDDLFNPVGLVRDALGAFFVTAAEDHGGRVASIHKVGRDGAVSRFAEGLLTDRGLALDAAGNLYAAAGPHADGRILRFLAPRPPVLALAPAVNHAPAKVEGTTEPGSLLDAQLNSAFLPSSLTSDGAFDLSLDLLPNALNALAVFTTAHEGRGLTAAAEVEIVHDDVAPGVFDLQPADGSVTSDASPVMQAGFADSLSGIDVASARIGLDGTDVTAAASVTPSGFTLGSPGFLSDGVHTLTIFVRDLAGNSAAESSSFVVRATSAAVARVEVTPAAALLTETGESRSLTARAFDAAGNPLPAAIVWTSSKPDVVHVDADGRITAGAFVGSAQIMAQAGEIVSAPVPVAVARAVPGAVLITDAQVASPPVLVDPDAPFEVGTRFRTVLRDVSVPAPGAIVLGIGEIPVAGRVVAAAESEGLVTLTLEVVPVADLVTDLVIEESIDLSRVEPQISESVRDAYLVTRHPDGTLEFVPREEPVAGVAAADKAASAQSVAQPSASSATKFRVPPFECEADVVWPALSITLGSLSFSHALDVDLIYDSAAGGLQRFALKGTVAGKGQVVKTSLAAAVEGTATCKLSLSKIPVPIPPILRFVLKPEVPLGVGFGIAGKVTVVNFGIEPTLDASFDTEVGLSCPGGQTCQALHTLTPKVDVALNPKLPSLSSNLSDQFRLEPEVSAFLFADFDDNGPLATVVSGAGQVDITILESKAGLKLSGSFATRTGQIADLAYQSDYKLSLEGVVGVGAAIKGMLGFFQLTVGADLKQESSLLLARSPAVTSFKVDKAAFASGDQVSFTVTLDPSTLTFPIPVTAPLPALVYNVNEVKVFQKKVLPGGGFEPVLIADETATSGQQTFSLQGTAVQDSTENPTDPFYAFVVSRFLPVPVIGDLELASAIPPPPVVITLTGNVTLHSHEEFPHVHPSLFEDTRITASVVLELIVDGEGGVTAAVRQAGGTGTRTAGADLTGCGRPPETRTGTIIGGTIAFDRLSAEPHLDFRVSGTNTSTSCDGSQTSPFEGTLPDGRLRGTPILSNGSLIGIDFNRTTSTVNGLTITTGVLTP